MKILLISASPRKERSQTFALAKEVLRAAADKNLDTQIIHLCDLKMGFCRHCEECHKRMMHCSVKDNVLELLKKMLAADGIILATPNYINQVAGSLKTLFDRASHFIHCQRLLGKYIVGVVSSGSGQDKDVLDYIKFYAHICGAQYSGGVSSRVPLAREKMEEADKLGNKFSADIREGREYPEQIKQIEQSRQHFSVVIKARKDDWQEEYQYWQDKDWL